MPKKRGKTTSMDISDEKLEEQRVAVNSSKMKAVKSSVKGKSDNLYQENLKKSAASENLRDSDDDNTSQSSFDDNLSAADSFNSVLKTKGNFKCKVCAKFISINSQAIKCEGGCGKWHHVKCIGISKAQYNMIGHLKGVMVWLCNEDKTFLDMHNNEQNSFDQTLILSAINKLNEKVQCLENKIDRNVNQLSKSSFADVIKSKVSVDRNYIDNNTLQSIIIKPKTVQNADATKKDIKQKINPNLIRVGISAFKTTYNGSVILKTNSTSENNQFLQEANTKLADSYDISVTKLRNPRLFINGLDKKYEDEELHKELNDVNYFVTEQDKMKILYSKQNKTTKKWMVSVEVSGNTFKKLVNRYVNIGWNSVYVKEDLFILRCFKCQRFHHNSAVCKEDMVCVNCAGNHSFLNCPKNFVKCNNCCVSNTKFNSNYPTNHRADSITCKIYLSKVKRMRQNTTFLTDNE